jgi:hypothetical protein
MRKSKIPSILNIVEFIIAYGWLAYILAAIIFSIPVSNIIVCFYCLSYGICLILNSIKEMIAKRDKIFYE